MESTAHRVTRLIADGVPLTLLFDIALGPASEELLREEEPSRLFEGVGAEAPGGWLSLTATA